MSEFAARQRRDAGESNDDTDDTGRLLGVTLRSAITAGALALAALLFYGSRLSQSPAVLYPDEVALARQAYSIAQTGRDLDGRLLPLFVHSEGEVWFPPLAAYAAVVATTLVPTSAVAVRWPSVIFGVIAILLVYRIARRFFVSAAPPIVAGVLLMLTPVHYMSCRLGTDGIFAVPFVLGSLASLLSFFEDQRRAHLWVAGVLLGIGFYSSTAAPLMMLIYLLLGALALWVRGYKHPALYAPLALGFFLPLMCAAPWFALHPESYPDTLGRWAIHAAHIRNPMDGLRAIINWGSLTNRASVYWEFLNPAFLFFPADQNSATATTASGPMAFALLILIPIGATRIFRAGSLSTIVLLLVGLVVAPLAAATFGENHAIGRALVMMPFAAIVATFGVEALWSLTSPLGRVAAVVLLMLVPIQFAFFHADYLSASRVNAASPVPGAR